MYIQNITSTTSSSISDTITTNYLTEIFPDGVSVILCVR